MAIVALYVAIIVLAVGLGPFLTAWLWNTLFTPEITERLFGVAKIGWVKGFCLGWITILIRGVTVKSSK